MKINIWLNDFYVNHETPPQITTQISLKHFKRCIKSGHKYILRGEPTLHPNIFEILNILEGRDYVLTTHGSKVDMLLKYKNTIPYIAFKWDGLKNDYFKGSKAFTSNILKLAQHFQNKNTIMRLEYVISNKNIDWIKDEIGVLKKLTYDYGMKRPYFNIFQEGEIFNKSEFTYIPLSVNVIDKLNKNSLLTQKTLDYLSANSQGKEYQCIVPKDQMVLAPDGSFRLCQSYYHNEVLGSIEDSTLEEVIEKSKTRREEMERCVKRDRCWMAYTYKDNVAENKRLFNIP